MSANTCDKGPLQMDAHNNLVNNFANLCRAARPLRQMILWGAFVYYGVQYVFGFVDRYKRCITKSDYSTGTYCAESLNELSSDLAVTVMVGFTIGYVNDWLGKETRQPLFQHLSLHPIL